MLREHRQKRQNRKPEKRGDRREGYERDQTVVVAYVMKAAA